MIDHVYLFVMVSVIAAVAAFTVPVLLSKRCAHCHRRMGLDRPVCMHCGQRVGPPENLGNSQIRPEDGD